MRLTERQLKRKQRRLLLRYYLSRIRPIGQGYCSCILLAFMTILFWISMALSIYNIWWSSSETFRIRGIISEKVNIPNDPRATQGAPAVILEIGGYQTTTDLNGTYDLTFRSSQRINIPAILRRGSLVCITRIDLPNFANEDQMNFTFGDASIGRCL